MVFERLHPRARLLFYLQTFSRLVFFWAPVSLVATVAGSAWWTPLYAAVVGMGWMFVLFVVSVWYPWLAWERWGYLVRDEELLIRRGVVVRAVTAIPLNRIQHVDSRQGPIEQWLGLARLQIHTASGIGGDGMIPGLQLPIAESLRDRLVEAKGDDGV
jgi:uncharacterized protein